MSGPEKISREELEERLGAVRFWGTNPAAKSKSEFFEQQNRLFQGLTGPSKIFLDELTKVPDLKIWDFEGIVPLPPEPAPRLSTDEMKRIMQRAMQEVDRMQRSRRSNPMTKPRRRLLLLV